MANNLTLLIAPQWDGNQRVDVFINGELLTFNRTTVGWKPPPPTTPLPQPPTPFNRTTVGWKRGHGGLPMHLSI